MRKGDIVLIEGRERVLVRKLYPLRRWEAEGPTRWELDRSVHGFKYWSEDEMRRVAKERA